MNWRGLWKSMSWKWMKTFSISPNFLSKANIGLTGTNEKFLNKNIINVPHLPAAKVQLLPHNIFKTKVCFLHFQRQFKVCVAFSFIFLQYFVWDIIEAKIMKLCAVAPCGYA